MAAQMERSVDGEDFISQIHLGQSNPLKIPKEELLLSIQDFLKLKPVKSGGDFFSTALFCFYLGIGEITCKMSQG